MLGKTCARFEVFELALALACAVQNMLKIFIRPAMVLKYVGATGNKVIPVTGHFLRIILLRESDFS